MLINFLMGLGREMNQVQVRNANEVNKLFASVSAH
ncbi:hypothetical protein BVRB_4g097540 [Beta vulgaris subsp. vulgaris]|uniref:Uncharacterized protein n=1 Tax=Beta vulgaris subsp. vulgaris TaxID=3555 RepID=A0A0J8BCV4_BETVV|nr:hypothetical protein BVRB_4g097540 [Beta vulgaris subsp. vulgaris]